VRYCTEFGFTRPQMCDPLDLEIIDWVYQAAWAHIIASVPDRDQEKDAIRQEALRKWIFALAGSGAVDFDFIPRWVIVEVGGMGLLELSASSSS